MSDTVQVIPDGARNESMEATTGTNPSTTTAVNGNSRKGFASMDPERRRRTASMGGKAAHAKGTAHEFTPEEAAEAGRKGGRKVAMNREHMAEIGRKGGIAIGADREHMAEIGRKGGRADWPKDQSAKSLSSC